MPLVPGMPAPDFTLPRSGGGTISLSGCRGNPVVLFFYPKNNTPACTLEARDFSALAEKFTRLGVAVIGLSPDSPKSHDRFCAKHDLSLILASDESTSVLSAYDVWGEKLLFGLAYMGVRRTTMLVDGEGRVVRIWDKVRVAGHAAEVLAAAEVLVKGNC